MRSPLKEKRGFTLIELLVAISIIGILSVIGLVSLNGSREKARDALRLSDLAQFRTALVLYFDSNDAKYPAPTGGLESINAAGCVNSSGATYAHFLTTGVFSSGGFIPVLGSSGGPLIPTYLSTGLAPPTAPLVIGANYYCYDTNGDGSGGELDGFLVYTRLESGASDWYWLNHDGQAGTTQSAHTSTGCHAGAPCTWL